MSPNRMAGTWAAQKRWVSARDPGHELWGCGPTFMTKSGEMCGEDKKGAAHTAQYQINKAPNQK